MSNEELNEVWLYGEFSNFINLQYRILLVMVDGDLN